tara:strand:+ start:223 stop:1017 length:795 start_codon:yes stop_codon:yes gene_type:complete
LFPSISDAHTAIEFTHRLATIVLSIGFIFLLVSAWKLYDRQHHIWITVLIATCFLIVEILLGAALVLFGWVESNASWGRVIADVLHVINTFLLVGSIALITWFTRGYPAPSLDFSKYPTKLLAIIVVTVLLIAITGTINSLADTLALSNEVDIHETSIALILISVRGIHPAMAIIGGLGIFYMTLQLSYVTTGGFSKPLIAIQTVVALQFLVGMFNIILLTPLETQILHLILAETLWVLVVLLVAQILTTESPTKPHLNKRTWS